MSYDPEAVRRYYDKLGEGEWHRLVRSPLEEIKLHIHQHYLRLHLSRNDRVLEIGAGPGRFTLELAHIGCRVTVSDLSEVQLELNRAKSEEVGFVHAVEEWRVLDAADLSAIPDQSFDAIVAYGGPFSYLFDHVNDALVESHRCLRPGGLLLASVMCTVGTLRAFFDALDTPGVDPRAILATGDLVPENDATAFHICHMFRSEELRALFLDNGFDVLDMSASNALANSQSDTLAAMRESPGKWSQLLDLEIESSRSPGMVDAGTHLIAVAMKVDR